MSTRPRRRRQRREDAPIVGRVELTAGAVVLAAAALTLGAVFLFTGGGDDDDGGTTVATQTGTPFQPADADGEAIQELGRRSVEALPSGEWAGLYDAFTQEFRDRCVREEFVAAGEADAANLGESLQQIRFKYLIDVQITGDTASGVIVGALGAAEYTIQTAWARVEGEWQIAPAPGTSGCNGFNRLSG
jgi:hypothetical protein